MENLNLEIQQEEVKLTIGSTKQINFKKAYEVFDWIYYIEYYNDVSKGNITDKLSAWNHWVKSKKKKKQIFFTIFKKEFVTYETFDWISYVSINSDLAKFDRKQAWNHWVNCGSKEERSYQRFNNTCIHNGRFGNLFFINMAFHFIAIKNNLKVIYKYNEKFIELGFRFFTGKKSYDDNIVLSDFNFFDIIKNENKIEKNITFDIDHFFCQTPEFVLYIKDKFKKIFKENVKKKNKFNYRYKTNNDVFLHVRLGDLKKDLIREKNKNYYEETLSKIVFNKAYISSDSIESSFCKSLIEKYKLTIIDYNEVETIMFASTCKTLILSGGTFSWLIGILGFYSTHIFYPRYKTNAWYDDIFVFENWTPIDV